MLVAAVFVFGVAVARRPRARAAPRTPPSPVFDSCPEPADPVDVTTVEEVEQRLVGTWLRCGDTPFMVGDAGPLGVALTADGRFFRVYQGSDGGLVRVEGLEQEGTWTVLASDTSYQVNLTTSGLGTATPSGLEFFESPSQVRFGTMIGPGAAVRWTGDPPVPGSVPGADDGPCGQPRDPLVLTSVADVEQHLVGTWVRCGETSGFGTPLEGQVGLEFTEDRRFYRVYRGADGNPVRGEGDGQEGTWEVIDVTSTGEPGAFQLNLMLGGRMSMNHVVLLQDPIHLRLVSEVSSDYQLWDGAPLPVPTAPPEPEPPEVAPPDTQPPPAPPPDGSLPPTGPSPSIGLLGLVLLAVGIALRRSTRSAAR